MRKKVVHNFNLSIKNTADIKSSDELTQTIIKELAKVSKEMNQQKDIVQLWQEQNSQNAPVIANNSSSLTEGGATDTTATSEKRTSVSNTPSAFGEIKSHIPSGTASISNALIGGGVADNTGGTSTSATSANTTSLTSGAENNTLNFSNGITTQTYANVAAQQTLTVPQIFHTSENEPTTEVVKAEIKKKLNDARAANDVTEINYWTGISKAFDEGATAKDFDGKPNDMLFTQMYAMLKQSNSGTIENQNFNWDIVRKKMIKSIDNNILSGIISNESKKRWTIIQQQLNDDKVNITNLFEQYGELFLLLKEVEGLDVLPNTITITTKTKIYPNLSADKLYAAIGKEDVYVFLKGIRDNDGSIVNKGALKIKNTDASSFIVGESLEFFLDEKFINQNSLLKENINWIVRKTQNKKKEEIVFADKGTSFSYNFDTAGIYRVDAYGKKHTVNGKKNAPESTFIELKIEEQQIIITSSEINKDGQTRTSTKEKLFKVALKYPKVKTLNPLKLYYQVETKMGNKVTIISEEQELDSKGIVKFPMPNLGEYSIKVTSKDQYALNKEYKINAIKNEVTSIGQVEKTSSKGRFLLGASNNTLTLEVKTFRINPATDEEKEDVKWIVYDSNNKPYMPPGSVMLTDENNPKKMYLHKWNYFDVPLPEKEGHYTVEAYSDTKKGAQAKSVFNMEMMRPQIAEAYWAFSGGSKKVVSGISGESNWIKANIPYYSNQTVRIYFYLNKVKTKHYCDVKTNYNGTIFKEIKFDSNFQKQIGFQNSKKAKIGFKVLGIQNEKPYPFKTPTNYESDTVLSVTTDTKILDAYFMFNGNRVTAEDEIPFDKKGTTLTIVAKIQNMVGKEIVLTAHKVGEKPAFRQATKVNSEGVAIVSFVITPAKELKNGAVNKYYVGIEGYSTKHLTDKVINMVVGLGNKKKNMANLTWGSKVNQEFRSKVIEICEDLWPENTIEMANGLMAVMYRETKGTFAANQMAGYKSLISKDQMNTKYFENVDKETGKMGSRAVGLIQFTQAALISMKEFENGKGFDKLHELKLMYAKMTEVEQLEKVRKYFKNLTRLPRTPEDIYVAVFAPDFVSKQGTITLYKKGTADYEANPGLDKNNDGIQKKELTVKYYESLKEANKSDNIASVNVKKNEDICPKGKCIHYADVVKDPRINNQSNDIDKNRWHRKMRVNDEHPNGYYHTGVDILAQPKTSLKSLLCGTVTISGDTHGKLGIIVVVKSKDKEDKNVWIEYCHLSSTSVVVGQVIKHGEEIGLSGHTGNAENILPVYYHVHVEASTDGIFYGGNNRVDPESYMKTKF